jgi:D-3-phosphoglycerate dehydrogenase/(S)-sulfolactate dehydrogenase
MTTVYVSDPVHDHVLAELRELGEVHLGYGPTAVAYQQVQHAVEAVMLRSERSTGTRSPTHPGRGSSLATGWVRTTSTSTPLPPPASGSPSPGPQQPRRGRYVFALTLALARKILTAVGRPWLGNWSQNKAELTGFELPAER